MSEVSVRWIDRGPDGAVREETFTSVLGLDTLTVGPIFLGWRIRQPNGVYRTVLVGRVEMLTERADDGGSNGESKLKIVGAIPKVVQ